MLINPSQANLSKSIWGTKSNLIKNTLKFYLDFPPVGFVDVISQMDLCHSTDKYTKICITQKPTHQHSAAPSVERNT